MSLELQPWLERLGPLLALPDLKRSEKTTRGHEDPKWAVGDLLKEVPPSLLEPLAAAANQSLSQLLTYMRVARAFPPETRVAASWTAHRELKDHPSRSELIKPGLSVREAAVAAGKKPIDQPADRRQSPEQRASRIIAQLTDPIVHDLVMKHAAVTQEERRARKAARLVSEEMAARQRAAQRELRAAREAQHPNEVFLKVRAKLIDDIAYIDAIGLIADEGVGWMVAHAQRSEVVDLLRELRDTAETVAEKLDGSTTGTRQVIDVIAQNFEDESTKELPA